ncbi:hypothetical protein B0H11DRAFT_2276979 [Mycena galericulata]|nr:hypothetical protein B0H11DRAFT_2276979 [Mycena galericulata]
MAKPVWCGPLAHHHSDQIGVLHASFADYLGDARRSGAWCIATAGLRTNYLHNMLRLLSSPPRGDTVRVLYHEVASALPQVLREERPSEDLFRLLRNPGVVNAVFLTGENLDSEVVPWPERDSSYPPDLIHFWEDHRFISTLTKHIAPCGDNDVTPTLKFDDLYTEILTGYPELVLILNAQNVLPQHIQTILRLFGLTYRAFSPFLALRGRVEFPFPEGDTPVDFVEDLDRAGALYTHPELTASALILRWIRRAREFSTSGDFDLEPNFLQLLAECKPNPTILHELETLHLSQICNTQMAMDRDAHEDFHRDVLYRDVLDGVVAWLQKFREPPVGAIEFWEKQITDIRACAERHGFDD